MKKILEKVVVNATMQQKQTELKEDKLMAWSLMKLLNELLFVESTKNLSNLSRQTLENVINALYNKNSSEQSSQVSTHGILILLLSKVQVENNVKKCGMINAFLLAWFTHLITKILSDITFKLFGPEAVLELFESKTESVKENDNAEKDEGQVKKGKKGHLRRRRRKSGNSENDSENDSEHGSDSNSDDDIDSDSDESEFDENEDSDWSDSDDSDIVIEEESNIVSDLHMMRTLQNHPMLESFRLCCLWFMSSKDIIEELGSENTNILWQRLASLINLTSLPNDKYEKDPELHSVQTPENVIFPEDKLSYGMKIFHQFHQDLDFENSVQLSKNQLVCNYSISRIFWASFPILFYFLGFGKIASARELETLVGRLAPKIRSKNQCPNCRIGIQH